MIFFRFLFLVSKILSQLPCALNKEFVGCLHRVRRRTQVATDLLCSSSALTAFATAGALTRSGGGTGRRTTRTSAAVVVSTGIGARGTARRGTVIVVVVVGAAFAGFAAVAAALAALGAAALAAVVAATATRRMTVAVPGISGIVCTRGTTTRRRAINTVVVVGATLAAFSAAAATLSRFIAPMPVSTALAALGSMVSVHITAAGG